jgi:uncharacterized phage protein gp47/JayE
MALSLASLLKPLVQSSVVQTAIAVLKLVGFKGTDWSSTSNERGLVEVGAKMIVDASVAVTEIAKNRFPSTAIGKWLDAIGEEFFGEVRKPAIATRRTLRVTNASGAGVTFNPGDKIVRSAALLEYRNVNALAVVIADGTSEDIEFEAIATGVAYNASSSSWDLSTPIPGVTVTEPTITVTVSGADKETDPEYLTRFLAKWGAIGRGNDELYRYWALQAANEIRKVRVVASNNNGVATPGWVTVILGGASGGVSAGAVTACQTLLDPTNHNGKAASCVRVHAKSAALATIELVGTVTAKAEELDAAKAAFEADLESYRASLPFGPKVSRERLITLVLKQLSYDDTNDLELTSPASDTDLDDDETPLFDTSGLAWVAA